MRKRTWYLSPDELGDALEECQAQGNAPTEKVCRMFRRIIDGVASGQRFRGYDRHMREDMASFTLEKCIRNIKNYRKERRAGCFSYFTRCVDCGLVEYLRRHYRRLNAVRRYALKAADQVEALDPLAARKIREAYSYYKGGQSG